MLNYFNWFRKKKKEIQVRDCEHLKIDASQSDLCYGGFKEYKPPIYEHRSSTDMGVKVNELFRDFNQ